MIIDMKLLKNTVLPLAALMLLAYLGRYIFLVDGKTDLLRLCLVFGLPFGIPYMLFVIPIGGNPASSCVVLALNLIIGAVFGCFLAAFAAVKAVVYLVWWLAMRNLHRKST